MTPEADDESGPMISLVLLLREPRYLEATILTEIVEAAWGGKYSGDEHEDEKDGFVVGEPPMFAVQSPEAFFMVNNIDQPYIEDLDAVLEDVKELRLRKALLDHRAWLSVDLISMQDEAAPREKAYGQIAKLIAELSGPDCLAIYQPATGTINVWDAELEEKLRGPNALEEFAVPSNLPVVGIDNDDPRMQAAQAEARSRWPEFVEAFNKQDGENFAVKVPITAEGNTEFIWVEVTGLEPEFIHGTLGNDPVDLGDLKLGDPVEVPVNELNDWGFLRDGEPFGLFTVKVLSDEAGQKGESIQ